MPYHTHSLYDVEDNDDDDNYDDLFSIRDGNCETQRHQGKGLGSHNKL